MMVLSIVKETITWPIYNDIVAFLMVLNVEF